MNKSESVVVWFCARSQYWQETQRAYVVLRRNIVRICWRMYVVYCGVWRIHHDTLLGLGTVRMRCVSVIS